MGAWNLLKPRKKAPAGPDLTGLKEFIAQKDRQAPPHFAGRAKIIGGIKASLRLVRAGRGAGLTEVVTAAPGGGKTSLLGELARRWRESGEADVARFESPRAFADPAKAMTRLLAQLNPKAAERVGAQTVTAGGGARVAGIGAEGSRALTRDLRPESFEEALALARRKDPQKPVAVLIDEAQGFPAGDGPAGLLLEAHQSGPEGGLPVLLVLAGLGDTRERLAECGLSKEATDEESKVLKGLKPAEAEEVAAAFFERFRVAGSAELRAEWAEALIAGTDRWPRHLTNALRGAAKALIEAGGDLARASLADALDSARQYRRQYYDGQLAPFKRMPGLLAEVIACLPAKPPARPGEAGASGHEIDEAIERAYQRTPRLARVLPEGEAFTMLLHKGLIQDFGQGRYACPIPSFRAYVEDFCASRGAFPAPAALEEEAGPAPAP